MKGDDETAEKILDDVTKEEKLEEKKESIEEQKIKKEDKDKIPSAHDLKKNKDDKNDKEIQERKEIENLTKELLKKGTLRKK